MGVTDYCQALAASLLIILHKIYNGVNPATQSVMNAHAGLHPDFIPQTLGYDGFYLRLDHILEAKKSPHILFDSVANTLESQKIAMVL